MKKEEMRSPYVFDGKVAVRDAAGDVLEMVESVLDRYGIHVPDEDQTLDENNACLYGMTYSLLMDSIVSVVADIVKDVNPEYAVKDCFAGTMGNQENISRPADFSWYQENLRRCLQSALCMFPRKQYLCWIRNAIVLLDIRSHQNARTVGRRLKPVIYHRYLRKTDMDGLSLLIRIR